MKGLKDVLIKIVESFKDSKIIYSYLNGEDHKHPSLILKNIIERKSNWKDVLLIIGDYIILTSKEIIFFHSFQEKNGHILEKIDWLTFIFKIDYEEIGALSWKPFIPGKLFSKKSVPGNLLFKNKIFIKTISKDFNSTLDILEQLRDLIMEKINADKHKKMKRDSEIAEKKHRELQRQKDELNNSKSNILAEFDKDGNGELDVVEVNNDFDTLVKKHQSKITEIDRSYILNFVKISNYQKTKRKNLQSIFNSIGKTKNQQELNNQVSLLKDQIHSYELILFHSLNMVTSLIEDDMFTFYEIYESFDKLEMFNSNHENEVSKRLINIEGGINDLMNSIRQMENNIIGELGYLSYVTQESYSELSHNVNKQLASIDSSIKTNSLLTGINAYQTYKLRQGK